MSKKKFFIMLIIIVLITYITTSGQIINIDNYAYVISIGIDVGENSPIKVSFQIANTSDSGSSSNDSGTTSKSIITSVETDSVDNAINLINTYISKELSLSHCKAIVISEELAYTGVIKYLYPLINKPEVSPKANIIVSSVDCETFLKEASDSIEKNSTKYYNIVPTTYNFTGFTDSVTLRDFFSRLGDTFAEPYTSLGNIKNNDTENKSLFYFNNVTENIKDFDTKINSPDNISINGIAVFNKDILVGKLNSIETICHLILCNRLEMATISIPNPLNDSNSLDLAISLKKNTKFSVKIVNNTPFIKANVYINSDILSKVDLNNENISQIKKYANSYIENAIYDYFYKTSKELKSDIIGLGKYVVGDFTTWDEWINYNWLSQYENSFFDITVDTDVSSGYLVLNS